MVPNLQFTSGIAPSRQPSFAIGVNESSSIGYMDIIVVSWTAASNHHQHWTAKLESSSSIYALAGTVDTQCLQPKSVLKASLVTTHRVIDDLWDSRGRGPWPECFTGSRRRQFPPDMDRPGETLLFPFIFGNAFEPLCSQFLAKWRLDLDGLVCLSQLLVLLGGSLVVAHGLGLDYQMPAIVEQGVDMLEQRQHARIAIVEMYPLGYGEEENDVELAERSASVSGSVNEVEVFEGARPVRVGGLCLVDQPGINIDADGRGSATVGNGLVSELAGVTAQVEDTGAAEDVGREDREAFVGDGLGAEFRIVLVVVSVAREKMCFLEALAPRWCLLGLHSSSSSWRRI